MRIQHNINALNAHRNLSMNNTAVGKNLEKLSSGFRINRAGDDAAGLAISEKMRGQIRGLDMATRNSNDGISLIQTAEGALAETHSILQRMRELAVQSSNGTYEEKVANSDREQLQKETQALKDEIDRIASSTHFNNKKLLNGNLDAAKAEGGAMVDGGAVVAGTEGQKPGDAVKAEFTITAGNNATNLKIGSLTAAVGTATVTDLLKATVTPTGGSATALDKLFDIVVTDKTGAAVTGAATIDEGFTIKLTAKVAGKSDAATVTALTDAAAGGTNGKAVNNVVGLSQGEGSAATKAKYSLSIDPALLKGGQTILIGDKKITFDSSVTASTAADGDNTIGIAGDLTATATQDRIATALVAAINAMDTATSSTTPASRVGATGINLTIEASNAGSAGNMGTFRVGDSADTAATISQTVRGADAGATSIAKFATATMKMDLSKIKAGDVLKFNDAAGKEQQIKFVEVGKGSGTAGAAAKGEIQLGTKAAMGASLVTRMEEAGFGTGKVAFDAASDTMTITSSNSAQKAADLAKSLKFTLGTTAADGTSSFPTDGVTFQIGANGTADDRVTLKVADQSTKALGIDGVNINDDVTANAAIDLIDKATASVSATRADLGALQNRLEHTVNNLGTTVENLTAAESRIRDVDMAKEMMEMTKNNILSQAAQSMLAQANTQPQGVLQLLQ